VEKSAKVDLVVATKIKQITKNNNKSFYLQVSPPGIFVTI
jgi:hypothetical protein